MVENDISNELPLEVKLVKAVKSCRDCMWFWNGVLPYGPYPAYDWNEIFPEEARKELPQKPGSMEPIKWLTAQSVGYRPVDPAVMHGCRKAPIMTIGINPNLTSFFVSTSGARWAYPYMDEDAKYAYYYRHQSIFQESLDPKILKNYLEPGTEIRAQKAGWLKDVERCNDHRWALMTLKYQGDDILQQIELAWTPGLRYIILFDKASRLEGEPQFQAGEIIAAKLRAPENIDVEIFENATGYYQRFINVLARFKTIIGGELANANLRIGEDVEQHDMIACASPGWSSSYDIPTERITHNCVFNRGFVVSQIIQSQPRLLVIVGGSSLEMFARVFEDYMDLDWKDKDIYQLLQETCTREKYLSINIDGVVFKSRLIACPHFSYGQNFVEQARFSPEAWQAFTSDFHDDYLVLDAEK